MIEMNRATRILHKTRFLSRQLKAISFGHKYIISEKDVAKDGESENGSNSVIDREALTSELLDGFDAKNNEWDRRILFEVTGIRVYPDEFRNGWSSDESDKSSTQS